MSEGLFLALAAGILTITLKANFNIISLFLLALILLYALFKKRKLLPLISLFILFFALVSTFEVASIPQNLKGDFKVYAVQEKYYLLKGFNQKFVCYSKEKFNYGSTIRLEGKTKSLSVKRSSSTSSFNDYLASQGVNYELEIINYKLLNKGDNLRPKIKSFLTSNLSEDSSKMISLLLLGDKKDLTDFYNNLVDLSIVQLFVISGFHLNILSALFEKAFYKKTKLLLFTPLLLLPYLWLLNFTIPVLRAFLFLSLWRLIKYFNINCSRLSLLLLIATAFLVFDYHLIYNLSFQLSFSVCLMIELLNLNSRRTLTFKYLIRPLLLQLAIWPLLMRINYQVAPLAFITNILMTLPISLLYVLSLLTSVFKFLDAIYFPFVKGIISIIEGLTKVSPVLITGRPYPLLVLLFYFTLALFLYFYSINYHKRTTVCFVLLLLTMTLNCFYYDIFSVDRVVFLDVGQGDATLICSRHNKTKVLIDTGGSLYYDVAKTRLIPYLKANGIRSLDLVIISHHDVDHDGALTSLMARYQVKKTCYGPAHEHIRCDELLFKNLNQFYSSTSPDNEKSAVLYFKHADQNFLIMGDAPIKIEHKICENYSLEIDVLRIGHHGSKTSSSKEFLTVLKPKIAIISVGVNYYGHPHADCLNNLRKAQIPYYRTDQVGNILISSKGMQLRV
ncbi:MAG: DNA internalization-related competence protein ComEC/Rec2 [Bacilli bacterium]|jgi:competence protein ComEC